MDTNIHGGRAGDLAWHSAPLSKVAIRMDQGEKDCLPGMDLSCSSDRSGLEGEDCVHVHVNVNVYIRKFF